MSTPICIVTETMEAYQRFCTIVPRRMDGPLETEVDICITRIMATTTEDAVTIESWMEAYKQERPDRWWKHRPIKEILSMLSDLPLNAESYQEVSELVKLLHM
jgi:hypothetical protein